MKSRLVIIFVAFLLLWGLMGVKALRLQILPNEKLSNLKTKQFNKVVTLKPRRGEVVDRNGKEIAVTVTSYSLYVDPQIIKDPYAVAKKLSKHFKVPFKDYYKKVKNKKRRFVWLHRQLSKDQYKKIKSWKVRGLAFIEEPKRIYPNDNLLSQTMGFVGSDGHGLEGLELAYEDILSGSTKKVKLSKDARGRPLLANGKVFSHNSNGSSLELTIDSSAQYFLEKELSLAIETHDADSAIGIVLDAKTSEILAMANSPGFNLNYPGVFKAGKRRNRVVTDAFEPGSTMKTFVIASALKNELLKPNTKINCEGGEFVVGDRIIREADKKHSFDWLTVSEVLAHSSNIGAAKISFMLGAEQFAETLKEFGFGEKTKVDLPGEAKGIMHKTPWNKHLLSNISFGHGITTTALQVAGAYAAIANGGVLKKPYVVKSIYNELNGEKTEFKEQEVRRVLTEEQAKTMRLMLMSATSKNSTGHNARVPGFLVAGKTGTAQKVDSKNGGYLSRSYISSFAGFAPANKPQFVIYIAVDNPRKGYYGSQVAAPIFSRMAGYLIRKKGTVPVLISNKNIISDDSAERKQVVMKSVSDNGVTPDLRGLSLRNVYRRINGSEIKVNVRGSGRVSAMIPEPGSRLPENKTINIYLSE